jgi:hypothetical protein
MIKFIIAVSVIIASGKGVRSKLQSLGGNLLDIRKNPHAIDVGLELNLRHSYWCIMWMETYTILGLEI